MQTLYRAATTPVVDPSACGLGACFTPEYECAELYTRANGLGGPVVYEYTIEEYDAVHVADAAELIEYVCGECDVDEDVFARQCEGLCVWQIVEDFAQVCEPALEGKWLVYDESGPTDDSAHEVYTTWRYFGHKVFVGKA